MDKERETGLDLNPKYDANGLITAVVTDIADGHLLMVGHMNEQALEKTLETGVVHFFSRSRQTLWKKGESSGNLLHLADIYVDCDQDALWVKARPDGPTCHTGERSCFYRRVTKHGLERL
jgi:phosphoribosyl-AMP cyclohydrolase